MRWQPGMSGTRRRRLSPPGDTTGVLDHGRTWTATLSYGPGSSPTPCQSHHTRPQSHTGDGAESRFRRPTAHERAGPGDAAPPAPSGLSPTPLSDANPPHDGGPPPESTSPLHRRLDDERTGGSTRLRTGHGPRGAVPHSSHIRTGGDATPAWCGGRSPPGHEPSSAVGPTPDSSGTHNGGTATTPGPIRLQPQDAQQSRPPLPSHEHPTGAAVLA